MIFHLFYAADRRPSDTWATYNQFIVRADTESRARELAAQTAKEDKDATAPVWLDAAVTNCVPVPSEGEEGVISEEFIDG